MGRAVPFHNCVLNILTIELLEYNLDICFIYNHVNNIAHKIIKRSKVIKYIF